MCVSAQEGCQCDETPSVSRSQSKWGLIGTLQPCHYKPGSIWGTTWSLHSMMMPLHMTFHKACVLEATGVGIFCWSGVEDTEHRTVGQMSPGRIFHRQGHGGTTRRVFPPGVRSVSPMHARVHARPSPHTDSGEDRAQVQTGPCEFHVDTAHCCYSPQRRYHGPEHRERRRGHSTIIRGSGRDVTALAPRLGGEPGCGSDVSGPVSSTRYSAICRPGGLCSHANGYCAPLRTAAGPKFP